MEIAKPLPAYLKRRFEGWKATAYEENKAWYKRLAADGQKPRAMVISCCDSRVHVTSLFGADPGEFFIHRNIAALVPPHHPDADHHGTSAAVEYAVQNLRVAHLIVLGHSHCGGIKGCRDTCADGTPDADRQSSYTGRWMEILRPAFGRVASISNEAEQARALEMEAVLVSLENLMTFPFVAEAVEKECLSLHGLWTDTGEGDLEYYDPEEARFLPV